MLNCLIPSKCSSIEIGGTVIDQQLGDWMNIWYELTRSDDFEDIYNKMIGDVDALTEYSRESKDTYRLLIPLNFWFCSHNGLSLPLISMRYHDIKINVSLSELSDCCYTDYDNTNNDLCEKVVLEDVSLYVDYVYLDNDERKKFAQSSHEYLITQVKTEVVNINPINKYSFILKFSHPVKELVWTAQSSTNYNVYNLKNNYSKVTDISNSDNIYYYISDKKGNPVNNASIEMNGISRFSYLNGNYFNYVQSYENHSHTPQDGINIYSFSLHPEEYQPSGSCNFSRLNHNVLHINFDETFINELTTNSDTIVLTTYAINYNILRFMGGLSGLAFSI